MAVQNSLARQDQSMKLSVYLQNDAVKKQTFGCEIHDVIKFVIQYRKCGAEHTGITGVYKP